MPCRPCLGEGNTKLSNLQQLSSQGCASLDISPAGPCRGRSRNLLSLPRLAQKAEELQNLDQRNHCHCRRTLQTEAENWLLAVLAVFSGCGILKQFKHQLPACTGLSQQAGSASQEREISPVHQKPGAGFQTSLGLYVNKKGFGCLRLMQSSRLAWECLRNLENLQC